MLRSLPRLPRSRPKSSDHVMAEPPQASDPETCARFLRDLGASGAQVLPIAEAALALASFERPRVDFARYRDHLGLIARDVGRHQGALGDLVARAGALNDVLLLKYGYSGDELTYDDLQNANLIRVIDRRKGLPVALGILYIHAARAQGWTMAGLAFPGHFLVRLSEGPDRVIIDPFHDGQICGAAELRDLLKAATGRESELSPEHYTAVSDRDVLLRLQNNLKARLLQAQHTDRALTVDDADAGSRPCRVVVGSRDAAPPPRQYARRRLGARTICRARPRKHGAAPGGGDPAAATHAAELTLKTDVVSSVQ